MGTSRYPVDSAPGGSPIATVTAPEFGASCDSRIPSGEVLMLIPQVLDCNTQSLRVHISDQCFEWSRAFRNCLVSSFETIHVSRARSLRKSRPHVAIKSSNSYLSVDLIEKHAFSPRFHLPKQSEVRSVQGSPWLRSRAETFLGDLKSGPKPSGHRLGERRTEAIDFARESGSGAIRAL